MTQGFPRKKILVDNDLKLNSASLKSRIIKLKNKLIFVDNSQEEEFFQNPYLIIILISKNPIAVFNSAQWNQCLDH